MHRFNLKKTATIRVFLTFSCFLLLIKVAFAVDFSGKVVGITDGDTISVLHDGHAEKIRLDGIDCPENHQAFSSKAKQFTSNLAFGKTVTIKVKEKDKYGRTVGEVILPDGRSVNRELLRTGFAWWYREYSTDQSLGDLEEEARREKRGLWADVNPIPPWDFRHGKTGTTINRHINVAEISQVTILSSSELLIPKTYKNPDISNSELLIPKSYNQNDVQLKKEETKVFITRTGKKYHRYGCLHLRKSAIPISLKEVKIRGYTPCSRCRPPQ